MEVLERADELARNGTEVIHLEVGEPDFPTPKAVVEAGMEALRRGRTKYTPSVGHAPLREAIAAFYQREYGVEVSPEQVVVTAGTSPALLLSLAALLEPGDEVLLPNPHYACYPNFLRFLGAVPRFFPLEAREGYLYDPQRIASQMGPRTKAVLVNSPANPTGAVLPPENLAALAELGLFLISDEIYHGLTYGVRSPTVLEFTDRAFVLNGFSKRYAMTGWRLGWVIAPREFLRPLRIMAQNFFISPADFVQWAGLAALQQGEPEVARMVAEYDRRRRFLLGRLREIGFGVEYEPQGAFYILADARRWSRDSLSLAHRLLEEAHVGVTPGVDFGSRAEGFLRFSYANSLENIAEGLRRIEAWLQRQSLLPEPPSCGAGCSSS